MALAYKRGDSFLGTFPDVFRLAIVRDSRFHAMISFAVFAFGKQFVRDHFETLDWEKTPPGPQLPADVVAKTQVKYLETCERLAGLKLWKSGAHN